MNLAATQSEKLNINGIKNINDIDFQDGVYQSNSEKSVHLHGRKPLRIRFFANGDRFFPGKKISIHSHRYQNIDELMNELTNKMPPHVYLPNGIRQLFTSSGGRRISEISQLESGRDYVCAGNESYKSISYGKTEREPWFKGRPHNFSRYPQLLPLGLSTATQNVDSNNNNKSDDQSHYAGQNAFPTRFYRPLGPSYLTKNGINHFASHGGSVAYPKLIKFKTKPANNKNVNYYQDLLNQQVKPKVITVVRSGPEKPKGFVRILLNKRSVQSYETLLSDIETSLRDHLHQKMRGIGRIFNLFGKEIKSVGDFFRQDDFFIAVSDNETLGVKQIKDILDDMYPDHPQTSHVLKYWSTKKIDETPVRDDQKDQDKSKNINTTNISVDKRDSGFEEQNFSKESEYNSLTNIKDQSEAVSLPKPKLSKSKPSVRKKKTSQKSQQNIANFQNNEDKNTSLETEQSGGRTSPINYQKSVQEKNADRLRLAYEERERARIQLQEQMKAERKKLEENITTNSNVYSQYVRKSVNDRGAIDVFKRMDEASQEVRRQKMREKLEKSAQQNLVTNNHINNGLASITSEANSIEQKENRNLPLMETNKIHVDTNHENNNVSPVKPKTSNHNVSPPAGKLNKINEDPSEYNIDNNVLAVINEPQISTKNVKKYKPENNNRRKNKNSSRGNIYNKHENKDFPESFDNNSDAAVVPTESIKQPLDVEHEENVPGEINKTKPVETQSVQIEKENIETSIPETKKINDSETPVKSVSIVIPSKDVQPSIVKPNIENDIVHKDPVISTPSAAHDQNVSSESKTSVDNPIPEKLLIRKSSLPGSRVMGKLCRQLSSSEVIYQRFEITKILGDGNFAIVKLALHKKSKTEYALKIIDKSRMMGKESMIENEIWIMKLCNHENIVKLKEEYETREEVFLVMELVKNGDLFDAITQNIKFSEPVAAKMVTDMANALFYLHSRRIVHRDLKPENLMVLRHKDGSVTLKLADFGLAMEIKKLIYTVCGTPTYVAPEILSEKGYSLEVDLWALGVITYILLCGFPPFRSSNRNQEELFEIIQSGNFEFISPYWDKISWDVKDLIKKLLVVDRKLRSSTIDVLSHKWLMAKGKGTSIMPESQKQRVVELEELAKDNLEEFQRQKKELRVSINREIQAAYQTPKIK